MRIIIETKPEMINVRDGYDDDLNSGFTPLLNAISENCNIFRKQTKLNPYL